MLNQELICHWIMIDKDHMLSQSTGALLDTCYPQVAPNKKWTIGPQ